jgi:tetratricopeptide (TPR) repeat protein
VSRKEKKHTPVNPVNVSTITEKHENVAQSERPNSFTFRDFVLPVIGFLFLLALFFEHPTSAIEHPWSIGNTYCDSSRRIQDPVLKQELLQKGGTILREQVQKHPYHARIWGMYGHYFLLTQNWDSCIYTFKKAIELGSGTMINSIEPISKQNLAFAVSNKLNGLFGKKDTALQIIRSAEVPGNKNVHLSKHYGLVYANSKDIDSSIVYLNEFLLENPKDFDALFAMTLNYNNIGNKAEALKFYNKARTTNPGNPRLGTLQQVLQQ